jgi:hypothetical protein
MPISKNLYYKEGIWMRVIAMKNTLREIVKSPIKALTIKGFLYAIVIAGTIGGGLLAFPRVRAAVSYPAGTIFQETWNATSSPEPCWAGGPSDCVQPWYLWEGTSTSIIAAPAGMPSGHALQISIPSSGTAPIIQTGGSFPTIASASPTDITFTLEVTTSSLPQYDQATFFCVGSNVMAAGCNFSNYTTAILQFDNNGGTFSLDASGSSTTSYVPFAIGVPHTVDLHIAGASSTLSVDGGTPYAFSANPQPITELEFGLDGGNQSAMIYDVGSDLKVTVPGMNNAWPPSVFMDWAGQSGVPTTATLAAGTHCGNAPAHEWYLPAAGGDTFAFASGSPAFTAPLDLCGSHYSGNSSTSLLMTIPGNQGVSGYEEADFNTAYSSTSVGFYFRWNTVTGAPLQYTDLFALDDGNGHGMNAQLENNGGVENFYTELSSGAWDHAYPVGSVSLASDTWYWATIGMNASGTNEISLYDTNGTLLESLVPPTTTAAFTPPVLYEKIGKSGAELEPVTGTVAYANVITEYADAQFPILPPMMPTITSFTASPSSITLGSSSVLSWDASNASTIAIAGAALNIATSTLTGTVSVVPSAKGSFLYTLTASNSNATSTATTTVTVAAPPPPPPPTSTPVVSAPSPVVSVAAGYGVGRGPLSGGTAPSSSPSTAPSSTSTPSSPSTATSSIGAASSSNIASLHAELTQAEQLLSSLIAAARAEGIALPLGMTGGISSGTSPSNASYDFTRNLTVGDRGADVAALQHFLIDHNRGPAAEDLAKVGATGYFGSLTRNALAEWQKAYGITPSVGYFGPITRGSLKMQ